MTITPALITQLRTATGAGMMDCKNALEEAKGDIEAAADILRKKGIVKAAKRADKIAAEGVVAGFLSADKKVGALAEVNSETDFVSGSADFMAFANAVAKVIVEQNPADLSALNALALKDGMTVAETLSNFTLKVGEKIGVRRFVRFAPAAGAVALYLHNNKIGVLVEANAGADEALSGIAMHAAAMNPKYLSRAEVSPEDINKEKEVYAVQLAAAGKPPAMIENILKGKIEKYYGEITLLEQPFIKDEDKKVGDYAKAHNAVITRFARYELGEGIVKPKTDFAAEVAEQLGQ